MIKKIRRKRIVIKQKELFVVKNEHQATQTCPVCRTNFATQTLSQIEQKQLTSVENPDKHECSIR